MPNWHDDSSIGLYLSVTRSAFCSQLYCWIYIYIYYIHSEHRIGDCRFSFGKGSTAALKGAPREHRKAKGKHEGAPREQRGSMREQTKLKEKARLKNTDTIQTQFMTKIGRIATLEYLKNTRIATRKWLLGTKN